MGYHRSTDTIAAIATPLGTGGIGIIRISGAASAAILEQVFTPKYPITRFESHKLYYGTVADSTGKVIDEVLAVFMQGPATYTVEDVVELHCHGSYILLQKVLATVFALGARPAEPGEFTKRAFLGGRIDLTQAEAVIDLLQAQTDKGIDLAVNQLQGRLTDELEPVRKELIAILALLEVAIDFPDDDVELLDKKAIETQLKVKILKPIEALIRSVSSGKIIREGISVVIAGRPNVGKSSLLNTLLREERALVTPLPGTTRDTIEETIIIEGIPVHLVDTAGIRAHTDVVEELGMERARRKMNAADLVLFLLDASQPLTKRDLELYATIKDQQHIVVFNKTDRGNKQELVELHEEFEQETRIEISAKENVGIDTLRETIFKAVLSDDMAKEVGLCAPNVRHLAALEKTAEACNRLLVAICDGAPCDLLAVDAQDGLDYLGDIIGLTTPEDVLDAIFNEFCIGK